MGGESEAAWRAVLDDLVGRGLRTPGFLMVDGGAGLERALAALWPDVPVRRCTGLEETGERLFSFLRLPPSQWKSARTTNAIKGRGGVGTPARLSGRCRTAYPAAPRPGDRRRGAVGAGRKQAATRR